MSARRTKRKGGDRALAKLRCAGCGYELRGLTLDAVCPECATPVIRSTPGGLLRHLEVYELMHARARMGLWCSVMILVSLWGLTWGTVCSMLAAGDVAWWGASNVIRAALLAMVGGAWLSVMKMRSGTAYVRVRQAAVWALGLVWGAASLTAFAQWCWWQASGSWVWSTQWCFAAFGASVLAAVCLGAFFRVGARFMRAMARRPVVDAAWYRWVSLLGIGAATAPLMIDAVIVLKAWGYSSGWLSDREGAAIAASATVAGGLLLGAACMVWAMASERVERRAGAYIYEADAAVLKSLMDGRW